MELRCPKCSAPLVIDSGGARCSACTFTRQTPGAHAARKPEEVDLEGTKPSTGSIGASSAADDLDATKPSSRAQKSTPADDEATQVSSAGDKPVSKAPAYESPFKHVNKAGKTLGGRFTLEKILGRGGMGEVWRAQDEKLNQKVAIKMLPVMMRTDPVAMENLRRETANSQLMAHPNIMRIHDLHEYDDTAFVTMEYVEGQSLAELRFKQPGDVIPWDMLAPFIADLCLALDFAHSENVIHRDIKPANIMIDSRGRVKLADFGIAATISETLNHTENNLSTAGTLGYMSPQQMEGRLPRRSDDIYALGATLYHLLTGKPPFYSGDISYQLKHATPSSVRKRIESFKVENDVPQDVDDAILHCLAKNPGERPQSATDVAQELGLVSPDAASSLAADILRAQKPREEKTLFTQAGEWVLAWARKAYEPLLNAAHLTRHWMGATVGILFSVVTGILLLHPSLGGAISRWSFDLSTLALPHHHPDEAVIVYLDDESHKALGQPPNAPWDRSLHAGMIKQLTDEGAKLIVFDILFDAPGPNPQADAVFQQAIAQAKNVVLVGERVEIEQMDQGTVEFVNRPLEEFSQFTKGWGLSNLEMDPDYAIRTHPISYDSFLPLSYAVNAAGSYPDDGIDHTNTALGDRWMRYYGPPGTIPFVSYHQALFADGTPKDFFRDKVVFIGALQSTGFSGSGKDMFLNPFPFTRGRFSSGVEVHATSFLNVMNRDWLKRIPFGWELTGVILIGLIAGYVLFLLRPVAALIIVIAMMAVTVLVAIVMLRSGGIWLPWLVPGIQIGCAYLFGVSVNSVRSLFEIKVLERSLSAHLPAQRVKEILKHPEKLQPGSERKEITMMFTDIAGFSTIADRTLSENLYHRLNLYYTDLISCIHREQGTVIQLTGDGIFAIWNAPDEQPNHQTHACRSALAIQRELQLSTQTRKNFPFKTRIGLHFGTASVGNYGSSERVDYTAIGANVNLASRIEGLNKYLGTQILASYNVVEEAKNDIVFRPLGSFQVKGIGQLVEVSEVLGQINEVGKLEWVEKFSEALSHFRAKDFTTANRCFGEVLKLQPDDGPTLFYIEHINHLIETPPPAEWMGEVVMGDK